MTAAALHVARSSFNTSLARYSRSWGLWALLLVAPIGARLWLGGGSADGHVGIAVNGKAPVMTSAMLGVSLGIVVSTLLLPIAFLYLRSSVTRRQPWQIEETTSASRLSIMLGRYFADVAVMAAALLAMTVAGLVIGVLAGTPGGLNPLVVATGLWVIAGPAVMAVAALRMLCDALPPTRGALGEFVCFVLWMAALVAPIATVEKSGGFAADVTDLAGFVRPLTATLPPGQRDIEIGGGRATDGAIQLDVWQGLAQPGYLGARLAWVGIALAMAGLAGLAYFPHRPKQQRAPSRFSGLLAPPAPRPADPAASPAGRSGAPFLGLILAEARLIGAGRAWRAAAVIIAAASAFVDYRHAAGPAALLILIFGLTAHAGRSEQPKLLALTGTMAITPAQRRLAFVVAGSGWAVAMALPAIARGAIEGSAYPLLVALGTGAAASATAIAVGSISRSSFAPRLILLIAWYAWLSA